MTSETATIAAAVDPAPAPAIQLVRTDAEIAMNDLAERVARSAYIAEQNVGESVSRTLIHWDASKCHRLSIVQDKKPDGYFQTTYVSYGHRDDADGAETYCESVALDKIGGLKYTLTIAGDVAPKNLGISAPGGELRETAFTRRVKVESFWAKLVGSEITRKQETFGEDHLYNIAQAMEGKHAEGLFAENLDVEEADGLFCGPHPLLS